MLRRGEEDDPPRVAQHYRRLHVARVEDVLDRHDVRVVTLDQLSDALMNLVKAGGKGIGRRGPDDTALDQGCRVAAIAADDAVSRDLRSGIDAENDHALAAMSATSMSKLPQIFCTSSSSSTSSMSFSSCSA